MAAPAIGRRARWAPSPHADIDWSHPLAANLYIMMGPHGVNHVNGRAATGTANQFGTHLVLSGSSGISLGPIGVNSTAGAFTASMLVRITAACTWDNATYGALWTTRALGASGNGENSLLVNSTGAVTYRDTGLAEAAISGATLTSGVWRQVTMRRTGSALTVMGDTTQIATATTSSVGGGGSTMYLGSAGDGIFSIVNLEVAAFYLATRFVADGELAQLVADPFCMLRS